MQMQMQLDRTTGLARPVARITHAIRPAVRRSVVSRAAEVQAPAVEPRQPRQPRQQTEGQAPRTRINETSPEETAGLADGSLMKVASTSQPKLAAGKLAQTARVANPPSILCTGAGSVNQAVKSIAIARQYLQSDEGQKTDLFFLPKFRAADFKGDAYTLQVTKVTGSNTYGQQESSEDAAVDRLNVSGKTKAAGLAGAIAARVREGKQPVLMAIGAESVVNAVRALAFVGKYLEEEKITVRVQCEFVTVTLEDRTSTAIKFQTAVEKSA